MRSLTWTWILLALVFGIGWTSRLLAERTGDAGRPDRSPRETETSADAGSDAERSYRGSRRGRFGSGGPFLSTVEQFADELGLDDQQRSQLDMLMTETNRAIEEHENAKRELMRQTRPRIAEILTDEQQERMSELVREKRNAHDLANREQKLDWLSGHSGLDEEGLLAARRALEAYDAAKAALFDGLRAQDSWPRDEDIRNAKDALRKERDDRLAELLGAETMEQFKNQFGYRNSSGRSWNRKH